MKLNLLLILIILGRLLLAQTYTEVTPSPFMEGIDVGSIAIADIDGDNDQDIFLTGGTESDRLSKLYVNDGLGNFTEMVGTSFYSVSLSSADFSDIDGDNDQDLLFTGWDGSSAVLKLYINDGLGNFTEMIDTPFENIYGGAIAFSDVDGDDDQDVLITGLTSNNFDAISKLYINDGLGNFTEMMNNPFIGVYESSIAFSDVDGDDDQDVLITGHNSEMNPITRLYINGGMGDFTEMTGVSFEDVSVSSVAFSDVDGDTDQDVLITGRTNLGASVSKLYINDGLGIFTEVIENTIEGVQFSSVAFSDIDGDNDQDLIVTGQISLTPISKLYINDGMGNFTEAVNANFDDVTFSSIAFSDVDGDNDQDLILIGRNSSGTRISKLYINDSTVSLYGKLPNRLVPEFSLYPNPTKEDEVHVHYFLQENTLLKIRIFDIDGKLVKQTEKHISIGEGNVSIDISSLNEGSYVVQLNYGSKAVSEKLIIQ